MKGILPETIPSFNLPPDLLFGYVSVKAAQSVFGKAAKKQFPNFTKAYHAPAKTRGSVEKDLQKSGFNILEASPLGFAVSASPAAFEDITGGKIEMTERLVQAEGGCERYVTHVDITGSGQPDEICVGAVKSKKLPVDGIVIEQPMMCHQVWPSPQSPPSPKYHLRLPDDVARLLGAAPAHSAGIVGRDVSVAMVDTGQYQHPFFTANGYRVLTPIAMVPGTSPAADPIGHGTGESANIFALAPGCVLQPIRASNNGGALVASIAGFMRAKQLRPRVLTNSWGSDGPYPPSSGPSQAEQAFALEVMDAIEHGTTVIFSAGNGHFSVYPQIPGVISAGGAYVDANLSLRASTYSSGFTSPWFGGNTVPLVCGLVGMSPRAQYLMLPVQPACLLDIEESKTDQGEPGDGTASNDGWALFSGTSAAAPQLAGAAALLIGAKPSLTPRQIAEALAKTATDVVSGTCHSRFPNAAAAGPDAATGYGLINAGRALEYVIANF